MISLRHLSTTFAARGKNPITAVDDVSLEVDRGSIQAIIGLSGTGKSTLLRNINLLERPITGEAIIDDVGLMKLSAAQLRHARHHIGLIVQGFHLVHSPAAAQSVELSLKFAGVTSAKDRRARVAEALEIVDISD